MEHQIPKLKTYQVKLQEFVFGVQDMRLEAFTVRHTKSIIVYDSIL